MKFYRIQHPEIYLLDLKVQYKHKIRLPLGLRLTIGFVKCKHCQKVFPLSRLQ